MTFHGGDSYTQSCVSAQGKITLILDFSWGYKLVFFSVFEIGGFLIGRGRDDLYMELWRACAGPLVDIPRVDEKVFYFPQGHMEQVCLISIFIFRFRSVLVLCSLFMEFVSEECDSCGNYKFVCLLLCGR